MSTSQETPPTSDSPPPSTAPAPAADENKLDRALLLTAGVVVLGAIMSILDVTVVNVAIPTLVTTFDTTLSTIQWVATGYTLALATVIPLAGWGSERFGTKRLYMTSLVLFVAGSLLSGMAWSDASLIGFRILQGFGGGLIMPLGMMILTRAAGPQRIGRVMAVMGIPMLLGPVFGPILGGWLIDSFSWRWIFFINLPIGAAALLLTARILPRDVPQPAHRLDWLGFALLSPSLAAIIYGLAQSSADEQGNGGGFAQAAVLVPVLIGAAAFAVFVWHALRSSNPLINLRLFRNKVFASSVATLSLMVIAVFGGMILLPVYYSTIRGESAMDIGLLLAPQGLGAMLAMPIAGRLSDSTGIGRIVPFGLTAVAVSFALLTTIEADTSYWLISAFLVLQGMGMGFTMMPLFTGAMQTLRRAHIASASTALNIVQQVAASIGTAVLSVILTNEIASRLPSGAGASGSASAGSAQALPPEVQQRLLDLMAEAFGATFWYATGLVLVALVVSVVLLPKRRPAPLEDDEDVEGATPAMMIG
jgi:EmrB/QacA subfamily drug resistance transporter